MATQMKRTESVQAVDKLRMENQVGREQIDNDGPTLQDLHDVCEQDRNEALVEEAVNEINSIYREKVDNGKLEIGAYLLEKIFNGDIAEAMSTNPQKSATFSGIAESPRLLVHAKTLGAWVRAAAVQKDFEAQELDLANLTTSHLIELAKVQDENRRTDIAVEANEKDLSVKDLRILINRENGTVGKNSDKITQDVKKAMKILSDLAIGEKVTEFLGNPESIRNTYTPGKALDMMSVVNSSLEKVQGMLKLLENFSNSLDQIVEDTRPRRCA